MSKPILIQVKPDKEWLEKECIEGYDRELCELGEYDISDVHRADRIYYTYYTGSYEGGGDALILFDGKWGVISMGHCSCHGPLDCINESDCTYDTIEEALENSGFSEKMKKFILKDWK